MKGVYLNLADLSANSCDLIISVRAHQRIFTLVAAQKLSHRVPLVLKTAIFRNENKRKTNVFIFALQVLYFNGLDKFILFWNSSGVIFDFGIRHINCRNSKIYNFHITLIA